jgi:hypothetical protein
MPKVIYSNNLYCYELLNYTSLINPLFSLFSLFSYELLILHSNSIHKVSMVLYSPSYLKIQNLIFNLIYFHQFIIYLQLTISSIYQLHGLKEIVEFITFFKKY